MGHFFLKGENMSIGLRHTPPYTTILLLAGLCLTATLAYLPGLPGEFIFDDISNIVKNDHVKLHDLSSQSIASTLTASHSGPLKRPISMLTFGLNYYFAGMDAFYFKLTNLIIHLLNGIGLFFLTRLILRTYRQRSEHRLTDAHIIITSAAICAAWLLHPLNLTGVLYVVQRMTSLSALFVIWGLVCYTAGRQRINDGRPGMGLILTGLLAFTPLAVLSKENGALLPAFMLVIEYVIFGFETPRPQQRRFLYGLFGLSILVPAVIIAVYTLINPRWLMAGYQIREFGMTERLLTESRVLWFYLKLILAPTASQLGLFHDDFPISHGLLDPHSTLPAVIGLVALLALAFWSRRRAPLIALGLLWFFVGHSLESTVLPLELVHEHRNYLPAYGILVIVVYYLLYPFAFTKILRGRQAFTAAFIVLLGIGTAVRASDWGNPALLAVIETAHHPESARANHYVAVIYAALATAAKSPQQKNKYYQMSLSHFETAARTGGTDLDGLFGILVLRDNFDHPPDEHAVDTLADRLEHAPFANNTATDLYGLVKCEEQKQCHIPLAMMGRFFTAALKNPTLTGRARAMVLISASEHLVNNVGNYRDAVAMASHAIEIAPYSLTNRVSYIKLLIVSRQYAQAHEQIEKAKRADKWGIYSQQIAEQEQALTLAQKPRQTQQNALSKPTTGGKRIDILGDNRDL